MPFPQTGCQISRHDLIIHEINRLFQTSVLFKRKFMISQKSDEFVFDEKNILFSKFSQNSFFFCKITEIRQRNHSAQLR